MEQESQRMEALKKAYADIILHTTNEAAARIMVLKRKLVWFQQNVFSTKEEALHTVLRVKQVMDSKIADMEITSLRQRVKIEELEAQLHEAEDVVIDLRAQLEEVQNELADMQKSHVKPSDEKPLSSDTRHENSMQAKTVNAFESISLHLPVAGSGFKDAYFDQRKKSDNCCFISEKATTTTTESSGKFLAEKYCASNPDLASIIMTSKEPELYRNGCTQRIRAFEQNLLDRKLPLPMQTNDLDSNIKTRSAFEEDDKAEVTCSVASPREHNVGLVEKKPTVLEESLGQDSSSDKGHDVTIPCKFSLRKSKSRYRKAVVPCANQVVHTCAASTRRKAYRRPGNSLTKSGEDQSRMTEKEGQKNSESHVNPVSSLDKFNNDPPPGSTYATGNKMEITKAVNVKNAASEDKMSVDTAELSRQNGKDVSSLRVSNCWRKYEGVDLPIDSISKDVKICNTNNEAAIQAADDRFLKYTFQRKRKKGSLSCPNESECQGKNTVKMSGESIRCFGVP